MVEPREPKPTIRFIDEYCQWYQSLFPEVRSFEAFKHLHVGMLSEVKRKTLPAIAKVCGLNNEQSLHHFLTEATLPVSELRERRLSLIWGCINLFTIALLWQRRAIPLYWCILPKLGNSNLSEQTLALEQVLPLLKEYKVIVLGYP